MGHYYDCRHCGAEDHNHTCPGKEAYTKRMQAKYAKMQKSMKSRTKGRVIEPKKQERAARAKYAEDAKEIRKLNLKNRKTKTRYHRRALDLGD